VVVQPTASRVAAKNQIYNDVWRHSFCIFFVCFWQAATGEGEGSKAKLGVKQRAAGPPPPVSLGYKDAAPALLLRWS
jgi:hypothetical protein